MKIKSFLEHQSTDYREVMYVTMSDFRKSRQKEVLTDTEYLEVTHIFEIDSYKIEKNHDGVLISRRNGKSLLIEKLDDEYFTVLYINIRFGTSKSYICDQFDSLLGCLNMIKQKGWLDKDKV